jgi:hypothetical protein
MTERACIRGCIRPGIHYATCEHSGPNYTGQFPCRGCAPRECRDGSLICDTCFGRMRALLADVRDLTGRLTALADPLKATPLDRIRVAATATEPPGPVQADLIDALGAVRAAEEWAYVDLTKHTNDRETVIYLIELILQRHPARDGVRPAWSVQDTVDQWGVERRTENTFTYPEDNHDTLDPEPVREWYDPILTVRQAAARANVTQRTVQRWIAAETLPITAKVRTGDGSIITYVTASILDKVSAEAETTRNNGGRGKARLA